MGYKYSSEITIENAYVDEDSTDICLVFFGTYDGTGGEMDLRTTANGGDIHNTDSSGGPGSADTVPADFVIGPNKNGSSPYSFVVGDYDATTGEIVVWYKKPDTDADADQTIYIAYSDPTVTTSQEDPTNVFNSYFSFATIDGGEYDCLTGNSPDFTEGAGLSLGTATGQVGKATDFNGTDESLRYHISGGNKDGLAVLCVGKIDTAPHGTRARMLNGLDGANAIQWSINQVSTTSSWRTAVADSTPTTGVYASWGASTGSWVLWSVRYFNDWTNESRHGKDETFNDVNVGSGTLNTDSWTKICMGETGGSTAHWFDGKVNLAFVIESNDATMPITDEWIGTFRHSIFDQSSFYTVNDPINIGFIPKAILIM